MAPGRQAPILRRLQGADWAPRTGCGRPAALSASAPGPPSCGRRLLLCQWLSVSFRPQVSARSAAPGQGQERGARAPPGRGWGAGRGAPPAPGATAGRPTPGWTGSASLARMALPAPRWSWAAASEPPGPWCGGGCVRPAKPQSDSRPAGGGPPGDSDRAAPGRGAGEAARVGRARAGGRRALTASELEGFAWPWRLELLLRDQTLVLCLKAALTFEGGRGRVRIGVRG